MIDKELFYRAKKNQQMGHNLAVVITGGKVPPYEAVKDILHECDFIVAADSGLDKAVDYGIRPDLVVGDMDSLSSTKLLKYFNSDQIKIYPREKDFTDTELALKEVQGYKRKILIGGGEGRFDHTLALMALFEGPHYPDLWITACEEISLVDKSREFVGKKGDPISFYPLGNRNISFSSKGLKWPLDRVRWDRGELSLSNQFSKKKVHLICEKGSLLVIRPNPISLA